MMNIPGSKPTWTASKPVGMKDTARAAELLSMRLPPSLAVFARLAYDFAAFWSTEGRQLFAEIDPHTWSLCENNPVRLLSETQVSTLVRAAENTELVARAEALERSLHAEHTRPFTDAKGVSPDRPVAFFCSEFGIYQSLPIYSGGLGVLAGDLLKESSDRGFPMVGMGLYYRNGYFHQQIDRTGWQKEFWIETPPHRVPLALVTDEWGLPKTVRVPIRGEEVVLQIWRAAVGRCSLYLLDSTRPENSLVARWLTHRLYDSEREVRLAQYALLGLGGVRVMAALGITPSVVHLNEGHAALAIFELARQGIESGLSKEAALRAARERLVFTTHTPVPAGNESYSPEQLWQVLGHLPEELGLSHQEVLDQGRIHPGDEGEPLGLTVLALRGSRKANGVSKIHGEVARGMWRSLWPDRDEAEVPISHITNGVHLPTWMAPPMREVLDRHLGQGWVERAADPATWKPVDDIPDGEIWAARNAMRANAIEFAQYHGMSAALRRSEALSRIEATGGGSLAPDVLTIGFARRLAKYKRLDLLASDGLRFQDLLRAEQHVQFLIAGKAHPLDDEAKQILRNATASLATIDDVMGHAGFVEDYDLKVAGRLVAGCDVWLNLPRPPMEASGTSGMKSMFNGGLNLSVLDGWWAEACDGSNGWGIPAEFDGDEAGRDQRDAQIVYEILAKEVVPLFYDRDASGVPRGWVRMIKASLRTNGPRYCMTRMLDEYVRKVYSRS